MTPRPFRIDVPEADLADLRDRLARTRWPDRCRGISLRALRGAPREVSEQRFARWTTFDAGGHFAALEQPEALITEIREFFRAVR